MTVTKRIMVGYIWMITLVLALAGGGVGLVVWLNSWKTDYSSTAAQVNSANEIIVGETTMADYVLLPMIDQSPERSSMYATKLEEYASVARDALASATSLEGRESEEAEEDIGALESLSALLAQYEQGALDVVALMATDPDGAKTKIIEELLPLAQQVHAGADSYKESQLAEQAALLGSLSTNLKIVTIVMLILAFMALAAGVGGGVSTTRTISRKLRAAFTSLGSSASELLAVASQVAASAAQTAASTNETTATIEEVKQTAQLAHEKAAQVAESSQNLAAATETGRATVEQTIVGFDRIQDQMSVVAETINRLGEQTQAVGEIIATVSDIAEQSNLLSVNASIEAAKAGDQGKGFTVVAQEVKNLAEQSKQAVTQVRTILNEIQKAGDVAVRAAERGQETVAEGREQSRETGDAVTRLTETAAEAAQAAVQISASSRQQLAGMEQISLAIDSINQAGNQSVAGTRQVEQEVKQLQELALTLKRLVDSRATA